MSRIPQPSSSRTPASRAPPPTSTPARTRTTSTLKPPTTPASRLRSQSPSKTPAKATPRAAARAPPPSAEESSKPALSIREAIALKRAEAKKTSAVTRGGGGRGLDDFGSLEDALPTTSDKDDDAILELGRWSIKETIERARSTGNLNISSRSLPCIPSALFDIHLGVQPEPLKSVPEEPPISECSGSDTIGGRRQKNGSSAPSWYDAQDLQVLKAWNNEIVEIQHEISLFGSLKIVDLRQNKLESLPDTFADLTSLTNLDLSCNALKALPRALFALPSLTNLNVSHNKLTELPFDVAYEINKESPYKKNDSFFAPAIARAAIPLPQLIILDASHNNIAASRIDHSERSLPPLLNKVDLSENPLSSGNASTLGSLLTALGRLAKLTDLRLEKAEIDDAAFAAPNQAGLFPKLRTFDVGETQVTPEVLSLYFEGIGRTLSMDITVEDPPEGTVRGVVGKKVVKEAWEIEAERRAARRGGKGWVASSQIDLGKGASDSWAGAREARKDEPLKEAWEIEAEQGLLTEGGKRRARAAAAAAAVEAATPANVKAKDTPAPASKSPSPPPSVGAALMSSKYYDARMHTLILPALAAPSKAHARSVSLAATSRGRLGAKDGQSGSNTDIALPTPSAPLASIAAQSYAGVLRQLTLSNRKLDVAFTLLASRSSDDGLSPSVEELSLDGCGFVDNVPVSRVDPSLSSDGPSSGAPRAQEPLLPLITRLFPNLRTLDLSYNALTSSAFSSSEVLRGLILASHDPSTGDADDNIADSAGDRDQARRAGLRHLRLRGNRLVDLDGLASLAGALFRGHRSDARWKLEELDVRDNELARLPAEVGLLPMDVFLVDGNVFRIPQRRVWEREGTKGLLSWLRGRIE